MSYDLGLGEEAAKKNDKQYQEKYQKRYNAMMSWLKKFDAIECGKSMALIECSTEEPDYIGDLICDLNNAGIRDEDGIRIYVVIADNVSINYNNGFQNKDTQRILFAGFIIGRRQQAPWEDNPKDQYYNVDVKF